LAFRINVTGNTRGSPTLMRCRRLKMESTPAGRQWGDW
jgi:hypothetical protein